MITFARFQELFPDLCAQRVRLVIADDSLQGRAGLRTLMEQPPTLQVVAAVGTTEELHRACERHRPTVAILDLCLPEADDGLAASRQLRKKFPSLPVLLVTGHEQERAGQKAKAAGAAGYALKNFSDGLLWQCALEIAAGRTAFPDHRSRWLPQELSDAQRLALLRPQEVKLLAALAGMTKRRNFQSHGAIKQLAKDMAKTELLNGLDFVPAERLARFILEEVRKKLSFKSSVEAARWYAKTF